MMRKHAWTYEENVYCCKRYIEQYVIESSNLRVTEFSRLLEKEMQTVPAQSIKMKLQNIKQILMELGVRDSLEAAPLEKYSAVNKVAMLEVLADFGIEF